MLRVALKVFTQVPRKGERSTPALLVGDFRRAIRLLIVTLDCLLFSAGSLVKELLADVVGAKTVVFEFVIGVNDQHTAIMDGGHQCLSGLRIRR